MKKQPIILLTTFLLCILFNLPSWSQKTSPPSAFGVTPTERQLVWHEMEFYGFIHYTVNAFTDKEWGYGDEDPSVFAPTQLDVKQWAKVAKEAGMKALILTAKHHDGFCLWPSIYTEHSIKNSPLKNRNIVKELAMACKANGLKFGIYLSPWDRNSAKYGDTAYITYYRNQLTELLTENGEISEVWFDGANGGDGYYGGAREKRIIDKKTYYQWDKTRELVRQLQPNACMFSDAGPDCRWCGNEEGYAGITNWNTINVAGMFPGIADQQVLNSGDRNGSSWIPAETDVSIRPGWFYHANQDSNVKSPNKLIEIYYMSVGRGANLLLNLPPDKRGLIHENDIHSLKEMRRILDATFAVNLASGKKTTASNTRGKDKKYASANIIDNNKETYWATDENVSTPELIVDFGNNITFNRVKIKEYIKLGQRIEGFAIDYWKNGNWELLEEATSIGYQRIVCTKNVTTTKVRLRITKSPVCIAISELGIYLQK
ncbi:MAG: alpha-L-fucosidase [Bacteroidota bacterium]